jgi:GNAT superfamily N-acetyltransferase
MRSHFGLLQTLTEAPPIAPSIYAALFAHLKACPDTYYIVVVVDKKTDQLVAHGTVLVEKKYIHGGSSAAHIEDIVVSPFVRRGGMGKKLVVGLRDLAVRVGCYKVILHCKEDKIREFLVLHRLQQSDGSVLREVRIRSKINGHGGLKDFFCNWSS